MKWSFDRSFLLSDRGQDADAAAAAITAITVITTATVTSPLAAVVVRPSRRMPARTNSAGPAASRRPITRRLAPERRGTHPGPILRRPFQPCTSQVATSRASKGSPEHQPARVLSALTVPSTSCSKGGQREMGQAIFMVVASVVVVWSPRGQIGVPCFCSTGGGAGLLATGGRAGWGEGGGRELWATV